MCHQKKYTTFRSVHRKCLARIKKKSTGRSLLPKTYSTRKTYRRVKVVTENARPEKKHAGIRERAPKMPNQKYKKNHQRKITSYKKNARPEKKQQHSRVHWGPTQRRDQITLFSYSKTAANPAPPENALRRPGALSEHVSKFATENARAEKKHFSSLRPGYRKCATRKKHSGFQERRPKPPNHEYKACGGNICYKRTRIQQNIETCRGRH